MAGKPLRRAVLEQAKDLRLRERGTAPGTPWGGVELTIPELDYAVLIRRFPDLVAPDSEIRLKAWKRFLATSLADPYRARAKDYARQSRVLRTRTLTPSAQ